MGESAEAERGPLDSFDQVVGGFGRRVGDPGAVPVGDVSRPSQQGSSDTADLRRAGVVLEVVAEPVDELDGEFDVVDGVNLTDDFLSLNRPSVPVGSGVR